MGLTRQRSRGQKEGRKVQILRTDTRKDLVADGHLLTSLRLAGEKRGIPFETFVTVEPDKAIVKAVIIEVTQRTAKTLAIIEESATDILVMRRLPVGIAAICKQQKP